MYDFYTPIMLAGEGATAPAWVADLDFSGVIATANGIASAVIPVIVAVLAVSIGINLLKSFSRKIG